MKILILAAALMVPGVAFADEGPCNEPSDVYENAQSFAKEVGQTSDGKTCDKACRQVERSCRQLARDSIRCWSHFVSAVARVDRTICKDHDDPKECRAEVKEFVKDERDFHKSERSDIKGECSDAVDDCNCDD